MNFNFPHTPETDAEMQRLRSEGVSYAEIAKRLGGGLTRNGVTGRLARADKAAGRKPVKGRAAAITSAEHARHRMAATRSVTVEPTDGRRVSISKDGHVWSLDPPKAVTLRELPVPDTARPWITRRPLECAFPVGPGWGADTLSCCAPVEPGRGYCPDHHALSTVRMKAA